MKLIKTETNQKNLERAKELHAKFQNVRQAFRRHWSIYGELAVEFEKGKYFQLIGYASMNAYLKSLDHVCKSTIQEAMKVIKDLPDMPVKEMVMYAKENLKLLANAPESKRKQKRVLAAARELKTKDFRRFLNDEHNLHLEAKARLTFDVEASAVAVIDEAIEKFITAAEKSGESCTRGVALEHICQDWNEAN